MDFSVKKTALSLKYITLRIILKIYFEYCELFIEPLFFSFVTGSNSTLTKREQN